MKATDIPDGVRKVVLARDRHRCRWCGRVNVVLHLHHIVYRSGGGQHHADNLVTLCGSDHSMVHTNKGLYPPLLTELLDLPGVTGLQMMRRLTRMTVNE
jgi:5-methylcytosine-specific restriction endonuclease McrA